jgi:hypothetical protein
VNAKRPVLTTALAEHSPPVLSAAIHVLYRHPASGVFGGADGRHRVAPVADGGKLGREIRPADTDRHLPLSPIPNADGLR